MNAYYTEVTFIIIFTLVIMMFIVPKNNLLNKQQERAVMQFYLLLILVACCEWMAIFLNGKPESTVLIHAFFKAAEYSLIPFLCIQFLNVINWEKKNKWMYSLVGIHVIIEFISIFTGWTFYIDGNNVYQHGPFNWSF